MAVRTTSTAAQSSVFPRGQSLSVGSPNPVLSHPFLLRQNSQPYRTNPLQAFLARGHDSFGAKRSYLKCVLAFCPNHQLQESVAFYLPRSNRLIMSLLQAHLLSWNYATQDGSGMIRPKEGCSTRGTSRYVALQVTWHSRFTSSCHRFLHQQEPCLYPRRQHGSSLVAQRHHRLEAVAQQSQVLALCVGHPVSKNLSPSCKSNIVSGSFPEKC
ncbi:hypothetical protein BJ741DRAFT_336194 [Chytriomyces cf. hyalinus JEL632]|nr:hypothetical protein BJ741DRAFT_336194 [Chytriomyces cf. hyalinus JEL632]